jgi:transposase
MMRRPLRKQLERLARSRKAPHGLVERARIILAAEGGESIYSIARRLRVTEVTVRKWWCRFEARPKLSSLRDALRSGRPAVIRPEQRAEVVRLACERPADNKAKFRDIWTISSLRDGVEAKLGLDISRSEVWRILQLDGVRPHRVAGWLHSSDPEFRPKVKAICDVYVDPPAGATVLCIDEKTGMQALEHNHPLTRASRRGPGRREFEYTRHGTVTLIGAFDVKTGDVFGRCERRTAENLVGFLEMLALKYPTGPVYIIWDNLNVHTGDRWVQFNQRHGGRFHFLHTPKHASWVNQIEVWFSILQRRVIRYGSFRTRDALRRAVRGFIAHWNMVEAHPFRWRFRGDFHEVVLPALAA